MEKICTQCNTRKPTTEFNRSTREKVGRSECRSCQSSRALKYYRENPEKMKQQRARDGSAENIKRLRTRMLIIHEEQQLEGGSKRCLNCKQMKPFLDYYLCHRVLDGRMAVCAGCQLEHTKNTRHLRADKQRTNARKYKYGVTQEQFDALFLAQGKRCAICRSDDPNRKTHWLLDHDHATKKIRGVLCHNCNVMLGFAKDDPKMLRTAANYLEHHRAPENNLMECPSIALRPQLLVGESLQPC